MVATGLHTQRRASPTPTGPTSGADSKRSHVDRGEFSAELESMAAAYGDDIDEDGSAGGAIHRGWMAVKDAISGSDPSGVLDAAEQGEAHAVSEYQDALGKDISPELRSVVERQFAAVQQAHDEVTSLRNPHA